jgi:gliding motility-associated-like protein
LLLVGTLLSAQSTAPNDDCGNLIHLGTAPVCNQTVYSNAGATPSDIGLGNFPACFLGDGLQQDVWFAFQTADTIVNYKIALEGIDQGNGPIINPQIAMYRGVCGENGLALLLCSSAEEGTGSVEINATGLTPNITYFLRIDHYQLNGSGKAGNFSLCVEELVPSNTIDEGGSTACSGRLYDSGGAEGNYQANEDYVFTICPDAPHQCINFSLEYYNIDSSEGDELTFYEGNSTNFNNIIAQFGGLELEPGGGVCFEVQSAGDCLTVRFRSNSTVNLEGFAGSWECTTTPCKEDRPISVTGNISNEQIVDFISTPQTVVEITDIKCPDNAYGTFLAGDSTNLGLERGLLLTTGSIDIAPGPNSVVDAGVEHNADGDDDLDYLSKIQGEGSLSGDACIVELDVFAATNELTFEYIFGSEEYPEFVNSEFNDIFAFFISGPGIEGDPNINNQLNIAVLPDGSTPVQINSVSHLENWQYFRNNELGRSLEYDGLIADFLGQKKSLTARAQVEPCQTYHLKLAIADRRDYAYDSGVFISELRGGAPNFRVAYQSGIDFLIEDCTSISDTLYVGLNSPLPDTVSYQIRIGGTAIRGEDYQLDIPSTITFLPGQTSVGFPIIPLSDQQEESPETIELSLINNFGCGEVTYTTITIELRDKLDVQINTAGDTILQCRDTMLSLVADGAADYFWTPAGLFEDPEADEQSFIMVNSGWVQVEGKIGDFCVDYDSVYVNLVNVELAIEALDPTAICRGDSVRLRAINNIDSENLQWFPIGSISDSTGTVITVKPENTTSYVASVSTEGCRITDTLLIDVDRFAFPELRSDTTICQNSSLNLILPFDTSQVDVFYGWTPAEGLNDPNSPSPIARPETSTTYTLQVSSKNGGCEASGSVRVEVLPADVEIIQADTSYLCLGNSIDLNAVTSTGSADNLVWRDEQGNILGSDVLNLTLAPNSPTLYYTTFETGICTVMDSILIQVDSLPPMMDLMPDQEKELYCEGETIVLSSLLYDPVDYPDLIHFWEAGPGFETADTLYNMVLALQDTFLYRRININNACADTSEIYIPVWNPPNLSILPMDTTICEGQRVSLLSQYEGNGTYEWRSSNVPIACRDCPAIEITPPLGQNRITLEVEEMDCRTSTTATVTVTPRPNLDFSIESDPVDTLFAGEPFTLSPQSDSMNFAAYSWAAGEESGNEVIFEGIAPELEAGQEFGELPVQLTLITEDGCQLTTSTTLIIQQGLFRIPNVFTPNGDGINDVFKIYYNTPNIEVSRFTVFNRWGKAVFQSTSNQGWDGTFQGKAMPSDVYLYHIGFRLGTFGEEKVIRGDVTLLR